MRYAQRKEPGLREGNETERFECAAQANGSCRSVSAAQRSRLRVGAGGDAHVECVAFAEQQPTGSTEETAAPVAAADAEPANDRNECGQRH